jgi:predicted glycogen debranching enzyme
MSTPLGPSLKLAVSPSVWLEQPPDLERLLRLEWLVANGLGGYASGTVAGVCTRRYHGILTAALPAPYGRVVMLNHLSEELCLQDGTTEFLSGDETEHGFSRPHLCEHLRAFFLRNGLPVWHYQLNGYTLEKQIWFVHQTNTVRVAYRMLEGAERARIRIRPGLHFRRHEEPVSQTLDAPYSITSIEDRIEVTAAGYPPLRLWMEGRRDFFALDGDRVRTAVYRVEAARGYESRGPLWCPGFFQVELAPGETATLVASTDPWDSIVAMSSLDSLKAEEERRAKLLQQARIDRSDDGAQHLVLAADQFIVSPVTRTSDMAIAHAAGDDARTVIAGYHWFTDWGRDTMISLEGLALVTGRHREARYILQTFARHVRDGLIPNLFPEGERDGLYHTADATLWFFHALDRYVQWTDDRDTLATLLPTLYEIFDKHLAGTHFGIGVDPADGLLRQGAPGYQLTWMDAKVGDWVVTPRRGKAVEINALWYNALRLLEKWLADSPTAGDAARPRDAAERALESFNRRFWYSDGGYLYDIVDGESGDDRSLRPNQLLAISLPNAVLANSRWPSVLDVVSNSLLTPMGLRTLAPGERDYVPKYDGDLRARDAAYHQGTVWGWLVGPFVDAWLRAYPNQRATARAFLEGFEGHLHEACVGTISEVFDAEAPYIPRGCAAQAWSVAEVLRTWVLTVPSSRSEARNQ